MKNKEKLKKIRKEIFTDYVSMILLNIKHQCEEDDYLAIYNIAQKFTDKTIKLYSEYNTKCIQ